MDQRSLAEFKERLVDYSECVPTPSPLELVLFACRVANKLGIDLDELEKDEAIAA